MTALRPKIYRLFTATGCFLVTSYFPLPYMIVFIGRFYCFHDIPLDLLSTLHLYDAVLEITNIR